MNLGSSIKRIRKQRNISQLDLARMCNMTQAYFSQIENNLKQPSIPTLQLISDKLEIPLPIIFFIALDDNDIKSERKEAFEMIKSPLQSLVLEFFLK